MSFRAVSYIILVFFLVSSHVACADLRAFPLFSKYSSHGRLATINKRRGLWVEAEGVVRPLSSPEEFSRLINTLEEHKITDVYLQIYRRGKAWYPSEVADRSPYQDNANINFYPIPRLLEFCEKNNIRVHAWINALRLGEDSNLPFLKLAGPEAVLVDGSGRSLLDTNGQGVEGCKPDTPGIWLDPTHVEVQNHLVAVIRELKDHYPSLAGIHFDYLRYPHPVKGSASEKLPYCKQFLGAEYFRKIKSSRGALRSQVLVQSDVLPIQDGGIEQLLDRIREVVDREAPHLELSSAVLPDPELAKRNARQDWAGWLENGQLDSVVSMNYTVDRQQFLRNAEKSSLASQGRIMIGLGAWLALHSPELLEAELDSIKNLDKEGVVLFSYANLANERGKRLYQIMDEFPR